VGDKLYGVDEAQALRFYERQHLSEEALAAMILPRHALHAHALEFTHPRTGAPLRFESELPADLVEFLAAHSGAGAGGDAHALSSPPLA
jgi:23S rRNA pseudouridine1911/1915/1917 synthase